MFDYLLEDLSNIFGKTETSKEEKDTKKFGEGYAAEEVRTMGYHALNEYNRYLYQQAKDEAAKIRGYRTMALYPEIGEVLEEIADEAVKEDTDGKIIHLRFKDEKFEKGKARENLLKEFDDLFYKRIGVQYVLWDYFYSFLTDGRLYLENIVNDRKPKDGIIGLKKLPSTTMDFLYDAKTGKILEYRQKVGGSIGAGGQQNVIKFDPGQISFFDYGLYGKTRKHIFGYLEKAKIPYRQLKLLEDSAIIYRIVRAPERLVFKVDVGNMPRHKAEAYINRMKTAYKRQMSYNPNTASIQQSSNILSMLENFWIPTSHEGRGSDVDVLQGGANLGEIEDIVYFMKKLYKSLKYPAQRVLGDQSGILSHEGRSSSEITRDEVKFAKFIERVQQKFTLACERLFLLNLQLKGTFQQYGLARDDFEIWFNPVSSYREIKDLEMEDARGGVYNTFLGDETISKTFLKKRYLKWSEEDIEENTRTLKDDLKKEVEFAKLRLKVEEAGTPKEEKMEDGFGGGGFGAQGAQGAQGLGAKGTAPSATAGQAPAEPKKPAKEEE
jgi:hypothetical protein